MKVKSDSWIRESYQLLGALEKMFLNENRLYVIKQGKENDELIFPSEENLTLALVYSALGRNKEANSIIKFLEPRIINPKGTVSNGFLMRKDGIEKINSTDIKNQSYRLAQYLLKGSVGEKDFGPTNLDINSGSLEANMLMALVYYSIGEIEKANKLKWLIFTDDGYINHDGPLFYNFGWDFLDIRDDVGSSIGLNNITKLRLFKDYKGYETVKAHVLYDCKYCDRSIGRVGNLDSEKNLYFNRHYINKRDLDPNNDKLCYLTSSNALVALLKKELGMREASKNIVNGINTYIGKIGLLYRSELEHDNIDFLSNASMAWLYAELAK